MDPLLDMAREMTALCRLSLELEDEDASRERHREYLIRRAAVADRLADADVGHPLAAAETIHEAVQYADELLAHDQLTGAGCGPVPAGAPSWRDDPRGYARQEHRAWVLAHYLS